VPPPQADGQAASTRVAAVQAFIDVPAKQAARVRTFWSDVTGWPTAWPWANHPELSTFTPPSGTPGVSVQEAEVPARVHVDLYADGDSSGLVDHLVKLGATLVQRHDWWTVLDSPGGLPLCVIHESAGEPPPATTWPDGHRSRVVQVCLDIPDAHWSREVGFWEASLGWTSIGHGRPEYLNLEAPPMSPMRILLQRLGTADSSTKVRAHLDLNTDDLSAEVDRLLDAGATRPEQPTDADGWVVLFDPTGLPFCVTARHP
jgi:hypothetical protein